MSPIASVQKLLFPAAPGRELLASVQACRALAALLVVMFHNALYIFALDKYWGYDPGAGLFNFAQAGVDFFFVISGFIIMYIHGKDIGQPQRLGNYARKRFIRIYPMYWLVLAFVIPIYFLVPSFGHPYHREMGTILSSVTLIYLDGNARTELAVGWTLYHEVLFYAVFALAIWNRRVGVAALGLWMLMSVASMMSPEPSPFGYVAAPVHLQFAMGMATCWWLNRGTVKHAGMLALLGFALFFAAGMDENYYNALGVNTRHMIYGIGSMLALVGLVQMERNGRLNVPRWLQLLGNASYSIYLTHFTLLSMLAKVFVAVGGMKLPGLLSYIMLPGMVVLMGVGVHLMVERPLLAMLNRKLAHRAPPAPIAAQLT